MSDEPKPVPPPGSDLALDAGCICPVIDNRHGAGMYEGPDGPIFVMRSGCPLHGEMRGVYMKTTAVPVTRFNVE